MQLLRRHKSVLLALGIYWPAIFWLTHIPVPDIARQSGMSDKTMHVLAYFALTFLTWFAVSPYEKIRWNKPKVWIVWVVIVLYAAADEYLQGRVGRSADVVDFASDLFGLAMGLGVLSIFSFWPALLAAAVVFIFAISTLSNVLELYQHYHVSAVFHFTAYAAFALIWIQHQQRARSFIAVQRLFPLIIPVSLLLVIKTAAVFFDRTIGWADAAAALAGICLTVLFFSRRPEKKTLSACGDS
ncbi:MAG: VanZ family protein [Planctomycetales bacterium]|nr:VanZ family protein [Planctomycetales bacterium]